MNTRTIGHWIWILALTTAFTTGCRQPQAVPPVPDYARPLPPGASALRPVTDERRDRILEETAAQMTDAAFVEALGRSYDWFRIASTQQFFPIEGVTHARARASVEALLELADITDPRVRADRLDARFDVFESVGYDGSGVVLFTGYYSPEFTASTTRTGRFQYPLYARPADLVSDPATGAILGQRQPGGRVTPYPT
ncbi:MAG: MltA domain-containing protein, partial [Planctomycetota bacterium]